MRFIRLLDSTSRAAAKLLELGFTMDAVSLYNESLAAAMPKACIFNCWRYSES
jgi:hypothetical protein